MLHVFASIASRHTAEPCLWNNPPLHMRDSDLALLETLQATENASVCRVSRRPVSVLLFIQRLL